MNPENTQPTDESAPLPPPPTYMPPIDEPLPPIIVQPIDSKNPINTKKPSNTPVWALVALAVFVVGALGYYGLNWYQSNMIVKQNVPSDNLTYGQQSTPTETNTDDSPIVNNCSETPDTNSVCIGDRIWMKQNINEGVMINSSKPQANNGVLEKYCYNDDPLNCDTYGGLYQWDEMMQYSIKEGDQGICSVGYHIPVDTEWDNLISYLGKDNVGTKLKVGGSSGFDGLLSGYYFTGGNMFLYIDRSGYFWSSTQISGYKIPLVYGYMLDVTGKSFYQTDSLELDNALSVRCIKNLM